MAYTHFDQVSGKRGVFKGAKGSEVRVDTGTVTYSVVLGAAASTTALEAAYIVVPYDVQLVGANVIVSNGTTGTGASIQINQSDTAGAALFGTVSLASAATAGMLNTQFGTMSTATITALGVIAITKASCATAYGATVSITATRVGSTA
jgi:hypothetical protein